MTSQEIATSVVAALEATSVPYMIVGSFSSNLYGIPRSTKDVDFVVELSGRSVRDVVAHLGPQFRLDPQMSFESVTMTVRHIIDVPDVPFRIELFHLSDEPHDQERFRRRRRVPFEGGHAFVASPEDVVITKLNWFARQRRTRDGDDVRDVLAVQGDALDFDYIHTWCDKHGTRALLDEIRAGLPRI